MDQEDHICVKKTSKIWLHIYYFVIASGHDAILFVRLFCVSKSCLHVCNVSFQSWDN